MKTNPKTKSELVQELKSLRKQITRLKERKRKKKSESGQNFRGIVENVPDQIIRYDRNFRRTYANPVVLKMYDLSRDELVNESIGSVVDDAHLKVMPGEVEKIKQRIESVFRTGETIEFEVTWPTQEGRKTFNSRLLPEFDKKGVVKNVLGIARDITELKEHQRQILALIENSPDIIARFDHNGCYLYVNNAIEHILGIPKTELLGKVVGEVMSARIYPVVPQELLLIRDAIAKVFATKSSFETEITIPLSDGERIFNFRLIPEFDESGQVASVLHIGRDITSQRLAEKQKHKSEQLFATAFRASPVALSITRLNDGQFKEVNNKFLELFEYEREEVIGHTSTELKMYNNKEERSQQVRFLREHSGLREFEIRTRAKSGKMLDVLTSTVEIEIGGEQQILSFTIDVTARKLAEEELIKQKEILQKIFDYIPLMISFAAQDGRINFANKEWERTLGWTTEELQSNNVDLLAECYPDPNYRKKIADLMATADGEWGDFKTRLRNGRVIDTMWARVKLSDGTSIGIGQDITKRKHAEETLRENEAKLRAIFDIAPAGISILNSNGNIIDMNPALENIVEMSKTDLLSGKYKKRHYINGDGTPISLPELPSFRALTEQRIIKDFEIGVVIEDGRVLWNSVSAAPLPMEGLGSVVITTSISERKKTESALRTAQTRLRLLSRRLLEVQENERRMLARELHDEIGQILTAIKIDLQVIQQKKLPDDLQLRIDDNITTLDRCLQQVRNLSLDLRPSILDDLGLVAALRWQLNRQAERVGFKAQFNSDDVPGRLHSDLETACFRIAQETLTNISRHAGAHNVELSFTVNEREIHMNIRDDGKGFDIDKAISDATHGITFGILSMQERINLLGGMIKISSKEGEGTVVQVHLPLSLQERND